jgi:nucleotide-binding universal stress UspA family protein
MMNGIRKILVPTDFSAHTSEAFQVAQTLALANEAQVILFHVARAPAVVSEDGRLLVNPANGEASNLWDEFHRLQPPDPRVHVEHEVIVADRPSAKHVLDILDRVGCDLIVMGGRGRSWLQHLLFGSLTEEVVRKAHCPVIIVTSPAHNAATALDNAPGSLLVRKE